MSEERSRLVDARMIQQEYGLRRDSAYELMHRVGCVDLTPIGIRKIMVWREDLERTLQSLTIRDGRLAIRHERQTEADRTPREPFA